MYAKRGDESYPIRDDLYVLEFFYDHRQDDSAGLVHAVCSNQQMWGEDLGQLPGFEERVAYYLDAIKSRGMHAVLAELS